MSRFWFGLVLLLPWANAARADEPLQLRVMTFNLWIGGEQGKQPLEQTAKVIQAAKADLVGLQETLGKPAPAARPDNGAKLGKMLGLHYLDQGSGWGILSRWPIQRTTARKYGVFIELPGKRQLGFFNVHLAAAPYQPYQLLKIPYFGGGKFIATEAEAIEEARKARGVQVGRLVEEMGPPLKDGMPVLLTGDFNEPSHLDWTQKAAEAKLCPLKVEFPTTKAIVGAGLRDAYRTVHADAVKQRGLTWTPITKEEDPKDRHDRIDMVFVSQQFQVNAVEIVGERKDRADIVVTPYPSDHRAVVATVQLE